MILSVSRRTDIPAYYAEWFCRRLEAGFLLVRNPMNPHQVSRIVLDPTVVDGIVFWSKNPAPLMSRLDRLSDYPFYIQYTLTPYGADLEPHVPPREEAMETFLALADKLGPHRLIWRYDPIIFSPDHTAAYHLRAFEQIARRLSGQTRRCVVSFLDFYPIVHRQIPRAHPLSLDNREELLLSLSERAAYYGMTLTTCAETGSYSLKGIPPGGCIDPGLLGEIGGRPLKAKKASGQRPQCLCCDSIDVGTYSTCRHGCLYCYAEKGLKKINLHDPSSPILGASVGVSDLVSERKMVTFKSNQLSLDF